ncbi:geranylgeranylglyceryl/heptaprenylglyceryl phosphate synthase [Micromonospora ureilytica]|uniref:geranylgeranylglyceryl/heptaprenylglyceryl phosphate synthase n=1 Tax=Micromonospora ureilytica TaxID=709868 RepID=UPI0033D40A44
MSSLGTERRDLREHLLKHRGTVLHVVDPFKIDVAEAVEKARAVTAAGMPALLLASTDYENFDEHMPGYVNAVRGATDIPLVLHFPPAPGQGFPTVPEADGVMLPALLGSDDAYYVWKSLLETYALSYGETLQPQPLLSAALTFGADARSYARMGTQPIEAVREEVEKYADLARRFGFDMVYLYSRNEQVSAETCRTFRQRLDQDQLLFVSGGVRTPAQVDTYLEAGADYVVFAGALEHPDWRRTLDELYLARTLPSPLPSSRV